MVELIIEGIRADLSEDMAADITFSLADIRTPDKRQISHTKTITLAGTATNNFIFGHIQDIDVENSDNNPAFPNVGVNFTPKKLAKCIMTADGALIFDGVLRLWEIVKKQGVVFYEITLYGKLFDLFGAMGEAKLTDLDFSAYNHAVTWDNITATWDEPYAGVFRYPLIDYGVNEVNVMGQPDKIKFGSLLPCIYYKVFLDKIFSSIGASYILNFADTFVLDRLLVTPPYGQMTGTAKYFDGQLILVPSSFASPIVGGAWEGASFTNARVIDAPAVNTLFTVAGGVYTFHSNISTSFRITLDYLLSGGAPDGLGGYHTPAASIKIVNQDSITLGVLDITNLDRSQNAIEIPKADYVAGNTISFTVSVEPAATLTLYPYGCTMQAVSPNDQSLYPLITGGIYDMQKSIPVEMKQTDFVKDFIKMFNLFVTQDPDDPKIFTFTPQVDFYKRIKADVIDWTFKIDHAQEIKFTPISQLTAKEYVITWKPDKDYWNALYEAQNKEVYGQVTYISDTDVLTNKETVQLLFSPAIMARFTGSKIICPVIYKVEIVGGVPTKKIDKFNSRLVLWGGQQDPGHNIDLLNPDGTTSEVTTVYPYAGHIDNPVTPAYDLNFSNTNTDLPTASVNTFSKYWGPVLRTASNKDGKLVSCSAYLKPADIEALDFAGLYKVDGQYYRLNKVSGFDPFTPGLSKIELIKVINL